MNAKGKSHRKLMAVLAVVLTMAVLFAPVASSEDSDAADETYSYTISTNGTVSGGYTSIANNASSSGKYTSSDGTNVGSWGFDSNGYGPFNSYYAAFDPANQNRMVCHLNPNNLMKSVDGTIDITGKDYNIMWVLPTVYWKTSGTSLVLTNDASAGGTAYAHTINGKVYPYLGIGVYEASTLSVGGETILTSISGDTPLVSQTRATFRDYANNQTVNTDGGEGTNGYAMVWNFYMYELYKYAAIAVMGSWDSQGVAGNGSSYGGSPYYDTPGLLNTSGPYAGTKGSNTSSTYTTDPVKVFIENAWGSVYDFVDGVVINGRSGYYIDQSAVPTDATSGTYVKYVQQALPSGSGYGSSPSTNVDTWGMPTATSGSASSGLYDYVYTNSDSNRVLCVGGYSNGIASRAPNYGVSYVYATNSLTDSNASIGGRLAFVFDADPASTQTVTLDHSNLANIGTAIEDTNDLTSGLTTTITIDDPGVTRYIQLSPVTSNIAGLGTVTYTHTGWTYNGTSYAPTDIIPLNESHTVKSVWSRTQIVTFDNSALTDLGASASSIADRMLIGSGSTYPDFGEVGGFEHIGWYVNNHLYEPGSALVSTTDHEAYSAWKVPAVTITFMVEGREHSTLEIPKGSTGVVYTPKEVLGVFMGWYYDTSYMNKYNASIPINADITLHAKGVMPLEFTSVPTAVATITHVDASGLYYFDATDSDGCYSVFWDFGDGNTSSDPIAYNQFSQPGKYQVTLTVTNALGDTAINTYTVVNGETEDPSSDGPNLALYVVIVGVILGLVLVARRAF